MINKPIVNKLQNINKLLEWINDPTNWRLNGRKTLMRSEAKKRRPNGTTIAATTIAMATTKHTESPIFESNKQIQKKKIY